MFAVAMSFRRKGDESDTTEHLLYLVRTCTSVLYQMSLIYICLWPGLPRAGSGSIEKVYRAPEQGRIGQKSLH